MRLGLTFSSQSASESNLSKRFNLSLNIVSKDVNLSLGQFIPFTNQNPKLDRYSIIIFSQILRLKLNALYFLIVVSPENLGEHGGELHITTCTPPHTHTHRPKVWTLQCRKFKAYIKHQHSHLILLPEDW